MAQTNISHDARHYDPENGTWDGQLAVADLVAEAPQLPERKAGGPLDRHLWVVGFAQIHRLKPAERIVLDGMADHSDPQGVCTLYLETLATYCGLSRPYIVAILARLHALGAVETISSGRARKTVSSYRLTGGMTAWMINGTKPNPVKAEWRKAMVAQNAPIMSPGNSDNVTRVTLNPPIMSPGNPHNPVPFSSNPKEEPGSFREDEKKTAGRKRKSSEGQRRAPCNGGEETQSTPPTLKISELRNSAPPAPPPTTSPDHPPISWMPGYCQVMLRRYRTTWLAAWNQDEEKVIRFYKTHWPKFLEDLQRHRANELANVPYGGGLKELDELDKLQPEKPPEMVNCARCGTSTTNPKGPVFRRVGGELECDVCYGCDGRNELQLAATATSQTKVE